MLWILKLSKTYKWQCTICHQWDSFLSSQNSYHSQFSIYFRFSTKESAAHAIVATHNTEVAGHIVKCSWGKESGDPNNIHTNAQVAMQVTNSSTWGTLPSNRNFRLWFRATTKTLNSLPQFLNCSLGPSFPIRSLASPSLVTTFLSPLPRPQPRQPSRPLISRACLLATPSATLVSHPTLRTTSGKETSVLRLWLSVQDALMYLCGQHKK